MALFLLIILAYSEPSKTAIPHHRHGFHFNAIWSAVAVMLGMLFVVTVLLLTLGKVKLLRNRRLNAQQQQQQANNEFTECAFHRFRVSPDASRTCSRAPVWLQLPMRGSGAGERDTYPLDGSGANLLIPASDVTLNRQHLLMAQQFLLSINDDCTTPAPCYLAKPPAYDDVAENAQEREPPPPYSSQVNLNEMQQTSGADQSQPDTDQEQEGRVTSL